MEMVGHWFVVIKKIISVVVSLVVFAALIIGWRYYRQGVNDALHRRHNSNSFGIIATVGNEQVTVQDLQFELDLQASEVASDDLHIEQTAANLQNAVLSELLERKILYAHLKRDQRFSINNQKCLTRAQELVAENVHFYSGHRYREEKLRRKLCEQDAIYRYSQEHVFAGITVNETEIVDFFAKNYRHIKQAPAVSFRQIVLADERQAKRIRHRLTVSNFSSYARKSSITPEAEHGGLLGPFTKNELPQVFHTLFSMRRGQITKVLKSPYGFHILLLVERRSAGDARLEDFRKQIELSIFDHKRAVEHQKWLEVAMHAVPLSIHSS